MATRWIYFIGGQSNAGGNGVSKSDLTDTRYDLTQTNVRTWTHLDGALSGTTTTAMTIGSTLFSVEAGFGYKILNTSGRLPLIYRFAGNGYTLAATYNPGADSGWATRMEAFWTCYEAAKTEFSGDTLAFGGLVWIQGEGDAQSHTFATGYASQLQTMITQYRREFGASLPVTMVQITADVAVTEEQPGDIALVRAAYATAAAAMGNCAVVDSTGIAKRVDGVHYTADGYMALADLVYAAHAALSDGTQHTRTARSFSSLANAQTYATSAQTLLGNRDENPANGGFGTRLGSMCKDPWPTTSRSASSEKHPTKARWYVPIDGPMALSALDTTTDARPVDLEWLRSA